MKFSKQYFAGVSALLMVSAIGCGAKQEPPHAIKSSPQIEAKVEAKVEPKVQCLEQDKELQFNPKTDEDCQAGNINSDAALRAYNPDFSSVLTSKGTSEKQCYQKKYYEVAIARIQKVLKENEDSLGEFEVKLGSCTMLIKPFGYTKDSWKEVPANNDFKGYRISEMNILNSCDLAGSKGEYLDSLFIGDEFVEPLKDKSGKEMKASLFSTKISNLTELVSSIKDKDSFVSASQIAHMVITSYGACGRFIGSPLEE